MTVDHAEVWAEHAAKLEAEGMPRQNAEEAAARRLGWEPSPWVLEALREKEAEIFGWKNAKR